MASWLKAAEDLFEVVDRRAKLVVSELADEQSDLQPPASNGQGTKLRRTESKIKAKKRLSSNQLNKTSDFGGDWSSKRTSQSSVASDKDRETLSIETDATTSFQSIPQTITEQQLNTDQDASTTIPSGRLASEVAKDDSEHVEVPPTPPDANAATSTPNGELLNEKVTDVPVEPSPSPSPSKGIEIPDEENQYHPVDNGQDIKLRDANVPSESDQEISRPTITDSHVYGGETLVKDDDVKTEPPANQQNHQQLKTEVSSSPLNQQNHQQLKAEVSSSPVNQQNHQQLKAEVSSSSVNQQDQEQLKAETSPRKIQDQLDEAQGLLKTAISTGQSKEARLARVCAGLSNRLQEYKSENAQLEELLIAERELSRSYEAHITQLQQDLSLSKSELTRVESNMADALAAKNSEIEALVNSIDSLKKQAAFSEGNLASLQANMESIIRNRELTETRMMQALREELASVERRAEEERASHHATKMAAMEREVELEHRAVEATTALARIQRIADERTAKAAELEQKFALLEVECASLNQELQDMEARARRGQKKSPEEANQVIQAWQEEVERARQGQRDAEAKLSSMEAEVQKIRVEMAAMKRDAEHYSRQEHMELEKRYRELTDLLYYKQTQLEAMASEKAAAEFQLEKEVKRLQEAQVEAERSRVPRRTSSSWEEDAEMRTLEPLPLHHRHMAAASMQLQKAAKFLDSGAARATRFLWRYPTARLILLFYLVFVHLFLMYLLHRLQEQADNLSAREVAESMGLSNPILP